MKPSWQSREPVRLAGMTERTLILVKPDGVKRGLCGEILRRIEAKGYTLVAVELRTATAELLADALRGARGQALL